MNFVTVRGAPRAPEKVVAKEPATLPATPDVADALKAADTALQQAEQAEQFQSSAAEQERLAMQAAIAGKRLRQKELAAQEKNDGLRTCKKCGRRVPFPCQ